MSSTKPAPLFRQDRDQRFKNEEKPFEAMMYRFDDAAKATGSRPGLYSLLRHAERALIVSVPVMRDNGQMEVYTGYPRGVQHGARSGERAASGSTRT
jgi:glutamate dehydrogenase (NAD(P)+)